MWPGDRGGSELGLDIDLEAHPVHRGVDDPRRDHAMAAQAGDEGLRLPAPERGIGPVAFAFLRPATSFGQPGIGRGLADEDEARQCVGEEGFAPFYPMLARIPDLGAPPLASL